MPLMGRPTPIAILCNQAAAPGLRALRPALAAFVIALVGCTPAPLSPAAGPPPEPSAASVLVVPTGMPTLLPSPTPEPEEFDLVERELSPEGPWLVGTSAGEVVVVNLDGTGRTVLLGPPLWEPEQDIVDGNGVSSSGWIAARTGLPNDWDTGEHAVAPNATPPSEVGIVLWRLPGRQPVRFISRFSDELLNGMQEIRDFELPFGWQATGPRWKHEMVFLSLLHPDARLAWSPDGRYLAFAAALDGPSADVYVYDTVLDEVRRLTNGPNQAVLLGWSPDSRWILHYEANTYAISHGEIVGLRAEVLWAVTADGSQVRQLGAGEGNIPWISGWLSPSIAVLTSWKGGSSLPSQLWSLDLDTGARLERQDFSFYSVAADPASDVIAVNADSLNDPEGTYRAGGLFVLRMSDAEPRRAGSDEQSSCAGCLVEWSEQLGLFTLSSPSYMEPPESPVSFLPSGEIANRYEGEVSGPIISFDGNWLAFSGQGVRIYDSEEMRVNVPGGEVRELVWSADSSRVFYLEEQPGRLALMAVSVPEGTPTLLHPDIGLDGMHWVQAGGQD